MQSRLLECKKSGSCEMRYYKVNIEGGRVPEPTRETKIIRMFHTVLVRVYHVLKIISVTEQQGERWDWRSRGDKWQITIHLTTTSILFQGILTLQLPEVLAPERPPSTNTSVWCIEIVIFKSLLVFYSRKYSRNIPLQVTTLHWRVPPTSKQPNYHLKVHTTFKRLEKHRSCTWTQRKSLVEPIHAHVALLFSLTQANFRELAICLLEAVLPT